MYRKSGESSGWATREIAALDFLLGIPLEAEQEIVLNGIEEDRKNLTPRGDNGGWWETITGKDSRLEDERIKQREQLELEMDLLERPDDMDAPVTQTATASRPSSANRASAESKPISSFIPGRKLDGHEATRINIPREAAETELKTTFRTVARRAAEKEWERKSCTNTGLLDGRIFFSQDSGYPIGVFSVTRYDPKNEEEKKRRQKLEALGGGGTQFILPSRDWRGISYRMLFSRGERKNKYFNQMLSNNRRKTLSRRRRRLEMKDNQDGYSGDRDLSSSEHDIESSTRRKTKNILLKHEAPEDDEASFGSSILIDMGKTEEDPPKVNGDESDISSSSSDESTAYEPGFLDDPDIKNGKHLTAMVGDKVTGCIVSSIIHYVRPADLKADLNRQFRQRFDQWEPPKSRRKYIGARVVDGTYKLVDPTCPDEILEEDRADDVYSNEELRRRKGSTALEYENIRIPKNLTLSKIRSVKQSALQACIRAKLEVSTVAVACVYFERLCLDCHVDKSNRRLTFAACLLIAIKINEANVKIVHEETEKESKKEVLKSWIKPRKDNDFFESLFVFFTHDWELPLKKVFAAEWGVFAALGFKLHVKPSDVAFHFKRLMKSLEWSPLDYLGQEMYDFWQESITDEAARREERNKRKEQRKRQREKKIIQLQRELSEKEKVDFTKQRRHSITISEIDGLISDKEEKMKALKIKTKNASYNSPKSNNKRRSILSRMGLKRNSNENFQPPFHAQDNSTLVGKIDAIAQIPVMHRSISSPNFETMQGETNSAKEHGWEAASAHEGHHGHKTVHFLNKQSDL